MFGKKYLFTHRGEHLLDIPAHIIMDNICDFEHVNFVHKRCFAYNRVVKRHRNMTFLEYGVKHIPGLPLVTHYFMIHERVSPTKVVHMSKNAGGTSWVHSEMNITEKMVDGKMMSHYVSVHERYQSVLLKPFEKLMIWLANYWAGIVWQEDLAILRRRLALEKAGFADGSLCGGWREEDGNSNYVANIATQES